MSAANAFSSCLASFLANSDGKKGEFDSVFTREILEQQDDLPIWHGVSEDVYAYSPRLLNRPANLFVCRH